MSSLASDQNKTDVGSYHHYPIKIERCGSVFGAQRNAGNTPKNDAEVPEHPECTAFVQFMVGVFVREHLGAANLAVVHSVCVLRTVEQTDSLT